MAAVARHSHYSKHQLSERPSLEFPLRLLTRAEHADRAAPARARRVGALQERPALGLHPEDAGQAGLHEGALALVSSPSGSLRASTVLDDAIQPGTAFLPGQMGPLLRPGRLAEPPPAGALSSMSYEGEPAYTGVRAEPARPVVALAGGALAAAVGARLARGRTPVHRLAPADLEQAPAGVLRVLIGGGDLSRGVPWWEVAAKAPPAPRWGVAVLDLSAGPEPLIALRALRWAGWMVRVYGGPCLPEPVQRLLEPHLLVGYGNDQEPGLWVGAPSPLPPAEAPAATLVLEPGGRLGLAAPVSGDPATLAAFLLGRCSPRAALRRLVVGLAPGRSLLLLGDPLGDPVTDAEQGVNLLVHEDQLGGWGQVWRVAAGKMLGVAAVLPPAAAEDVEAIWHADLDPTLLRHRCPVW